MDTATTNPHATSRAHVVRPQGAPLHWTTSGFHIRSWSPRDRDAAAAVIRTVLAEYGLGWEPEGADRDVIDVELAYWATGGEFWVVVDRRGGSDGGGGEAAVVGTAAFYPRRPGAAEVEIRKMYLSESARGKGMGSVLLRALETRAAQLGYVKAVVETASVLVEACELYRKRGYTPVDEVETVRCDTALDKELPLFSSSHTDSVVLDDNGFVVMITPDECERAAAATTEP